ncbi:MAG: hypothetical protein AYK22_02650 [Thermoplasmatales archaeon SG8-52-3]|nr:MAG: hypothetical protein AYK22_02650 [Thermoplasmatales archaeon SG8-52-3]
MKNLIILIILTIFFINSTISVNGLDEKNSQIIIGPYPQNPEFDSITIIWETNISTTNNSVHYGLTQDCEQKKYNNISGNFHTVELNGLISSTKYFYKVVSDHIESSIYSFYTKFEENSSTRFVIYGDSRGVWDNWVNASIVADKIEIEHPYFVLHTGDFVKNGIYIDQWIDFFSISTFIHNSTLYPALGNHEQYGEAYFKYFLLRNNEPWYSFDYGSVHFISLDSNFRNSIKLSQLSWLLKDLKSNNQPFTIIFFHHPPYSSGNHGSTIYLRFIWGLFFEYFNVDIVFNGHDHCYERGKVKSVNYIVTGGGGAPPYDTGNKWWTVHSEKTFHYCLISCNNDQLSFNAIKLNGTIFDSFVIQK